jgi:glycine dehydrogenase subunit 2
MSQLIFETSRLNRYAVTQAPLEDVEVDDLPKEHLRETKPLLPETSELDVVRHFTNLSQQNFSVDTNFYPLGSCTMKYNPRCLNTLASLPDFLGCHPLDLEKNNQGYMQCAYETQEMLKIITGMTGISLTPMAGAQGEFAGVLMIRAYHDSRGDTERTEIIIPDAAHGTNPASASMCGYVTKEIPTKTSDGDIDIEALKAAVGPKTAGIMLTNPSTLGVFERRIEEVAKIVHDAGGLLYYDGANLNAILGKVRPGDMGFDVIHLNLHKTFGTPHGGGGPGSGPIVCNERLIPFLPIPYIEKSEKGYTWVTEKQCPQSIGRLSAFMGNAAIILRSYIYLRLLGKKGLPRVADFSTLNANYLMVRLRDAGFTISFPDRRAVHEFIVTLEDQTKKYGVRALDYAKRLLDYDAHAPTIYFPLLIPECLLIEPTETESKEAVDQFVETMIKIKHEAETDSELVKTAPHDRPLRRLDDVKAARELNLVYNPKSDS